MIFYFYYNGVEYDDFVDKCFFNVCTCSCWRRVWSGGGTVWEEQEVDKSTEEGHHKDRGRTYCVTTRERRWLDDILKERDRVSKERVLESAQVVVTEVVVTTVTVLVVPVVTTVESGYILLVSRCLDTLWHPRYNVHQRPAENGPGQEGDPCRNTLTHLHDCCFLLRKRCRMWFSRHVVSRGDGSMEVESMVTQNHSQPSSDRF